MTHKKIEVSKLPKCDFCARSAKYDGKTQHGSWANMCPSHFDFWGVGLGLGRGQELILKKASKKKLDKAGFDVWMRKVDKALIGLCGMHSEDLPDQLYYDKYEAGQTSKDAAKEVFDDCMSEYGDYRDYGI